MSRNIYQFTKYLSVYVDDCVLSCESSQLLEETLKQLDALHPLCLSRIKAVGVEEDDITWKLFDILGADVLYSQSLE